MKRESPRIATALLNRLSNNEALAGDLREAYAAGKSRAWYWGQVLAEIAIRPWRGSSQQRWLAVGTILTAVMLVWTADHLTASVRGWLLYQVIQPAAWSHPVIAAHGFMVLWITDVAPFAIAALASGWIIGGLNRTHRGLVFLFSSVVFVGLLWRWSIVAVRVMFVTPHHSPIAYLLLFVAGQIVLPPALALVGTLRPEATARAKAG